MICQKCKEEGKKSRVYEVGGGATTLMGHFPYYDEEGQYHSHNPNTTTHGYKCSNGHEWTTISRGSCWCGWGKE